MSEEREYEDCCCSRCRQGAPCSELRRCERCYESLCYDCFDPRADFCRECDPPPAKWKKLTEDKATWPENWARCWISTAVGGPQEDVYAFASEWSCFEETVAWVVNTEAYSGESYKVGEVTHWAPASPPPFDGED